MKKSELIKKIDILTTSQKIDISQKQKLLCAKRHLLCNRFLEASKIICLGALIDEENWGSFLCNQKTFPDKTEAENCSKCFLDNCQCPPKQDN